MSNTNTAHGVSHTQKIQIQVSLPSDLIAQILTAADTAGQTVADYLSEAIREKLG